MSPEADLYYMRNRWYEPWTGRFLSEDPSGVANGLNEYVYASGDPVNSADPTGLDSNPECPFICVTVPRPSDPDAQARNDQIYNQGCTGQNMPTPTGVCWDPNAEADYPEAPLPPPPPQLLTPTGPNCSAAWREFGKSLVLDALGVELLKGFEGIRRSVELGEDATALATRAGELRGGASIAKSIRAGQVRAMASSAFIRGGVGLGAAAVDDAETLGAGPGSVYYRVALLVPGLGSGLRLGAAIDCTVGADTPSWAH
jgi:hypothetical protein